MRIDSVAQPEVEKIRQYWDRQPCNVRRSTYPVGTAMWSADITATKYEVEPHIRGFADFDRWMGKQVLEIGCGIGTDTLEFCRAGACVTAVDLSRESIKLAEGRINQVGLYADFHCCNAEEYLPPGQFDLVYSFGVLHHTPNPFTVLLRAYHRLKIGGELRIMLYAKHSIKNWLGEQPEAQAGCPLAVRYSGIKARRLVESAGFTVKSIQKRHIFPYRIADYIQHRYAKRTAYRVMPGWMFRGLERVCGDHLLIRAVKE